MARERIVRRLGATAAMSMAALGAEALYVAMRDLPEFDGFDVSGTFGSEGATPLRVVAVGDSACTGPGVDHPDQVWLRLVAARLAERFHVSLISLGVGGSRSGDLIRDQLDRAVELRPDLALVVVGVNDMLRGVPVPTFERRLDRIAAALAPVSRLLVLFGMGDLGTIPRLPPPLDLVARWRGRQGDAIHAKVAARYGAVKADVWALTTQQFRTNPEIFAPDLFHPSAVGHRVWAEAAWATIEPHLHRLS